METEDKTKRKRQKKLCKQIRDQMEFYFSDANLQKDRFLRKEIDKTEDGWLDLDMFSNFNKLKTLTTDMVLVSKALSTSELIQVSEDGQQIKRKFPVTDAKDVDDRTVYVEHLPAGADHVWVKRVFSEIGRVVYVSLPRYRSTRDLKGFGFVEFQTKEDAQRACKELNQMGQDEDKVGRFPTKHNRQMQDLQKRVSSHKGGRRTRALSETEAMEILAEDRKDALGGGRVRKRRWSQGSDQENGASAMKRSKLNKEASDESDDSSDSDYEPQVTKSKKSENQPETGSAKNRKRKSSKSEVFDDEDTKACKRETMGASKKEQEAGAKQEVKKDASKEEEAAKKKKSRKKKKKVKEESKETPGLKVISKKDWLELRSEYLTLQKQSMKKLKQALKQVSINPSTNQVTAEESVEMMDKENTATKSKEPEFTPGVIVKIQSTGPLNRKQIKGKLEEFGDIAYVDVVEGDSEGHVRCSSSKDAIGIAAAAVEGYTLSVLTGESDKQYWEKLVADRTKKLSSKARNKKRGKDKTIEKAGVPTDTSTSQKKKHIVFDDD